MKPKKFQIYDDAFYFILVRDTDIISIVSIHNGTNQICYHGTGNVDTMDKFRKDIQSGRIEVIEKIPLPKIKKKK